MKTYKLWLYVEEIDEEKDTYEDITIPINIGEYAEKDLALEYADSLHINRPEL